MTETELQQASEVITGSVETPVKFNRMELLRNSIFILQRMEVRLMGDRWKARETDKDFLSYVRAYAQLLSTVDGVAKSCEIDELQQQIDEINEQNGNNRRW